MLHQCTLNVFTYRVYPTEHFIILGFIWSYAAVIISRCSHKCLPTVVNCGYHICGCQLHHLLFCKRLQIVTDGRRWIKEIDFSEIAYRGCLKWFDVTDDCKWIQLQWIYGIMLCCYVKIKLPIFPLSKGREIVSSHHPSSPPSFKAGVCRKERCLCHDS